MLYICLVVFNLWSFTDNKYKENKDGTQIYTIQNFVFTAGIDNYNMFKLIEFCKNSKISQKVKDKVPILSFYTFFSKIKF